jgi:O-acetylserine/cysteine efflux transporter
MNFRDATVGLLLMALWGLNFSIIKIGVQEINPLLLVALRFAFAVFPIILFVRKPNVPNHFLLIYGLTFGTGVWGLVTWSIELGLSAGVASLILETSFILSALAGYFVLKESIKLSMWVGLTLAAIGLALLAFSTEGSVSFAGVILALLGAFFWAVTGIVVKKANPKKVFAFSVWGMLWVPLPLIFLTVISQGLDPITNLPGQLNDRAVFSVLFQAYPTTLFGYWLWNYLVVKYPLNVVSPLILLVPVFSMLGGFFIHDENITEIEVVSCILISLGVILPQLSKYIIRIKCKFL